MELTVSQPCTVQCTEGDHLTLIHNDCHNHLLNVFGCTAELPLQRRIHEIGASLKLMST